MVLECSLPIGWQGEAYWAVTTFFKVACPTVIEGRKLNRKNAEPGTPELCQILTVGCAPREAQATFRTCRDQTLEFAGRKYPQIHNKSYF